MNAVFIEEVLEWDKETKETRATIQLYNYTARPRAYTLLSTWPERDGVQISENERGGRREAKGLWAWKLETLDPGKSTTLTFTVSGLKKGDWSDIEIFFRGAGDIIGATKLDEEILAEMLREEEAGLERELDEDLESDGDDDAESTEVLAIDEQNSTEEPGGSDQSDWFGLGGDEQ